MPYPPADIWDRVHVEDLKLPGPARQFNQGQASAVDAAPISFGSAGAQLGWNSGPESTGRLKRGAEDSWLAGSNMSQPRSGFGTEDDAASDAAWSYGPSTNMSMSASMLSMYHGAGGSTSGYVSISAATASSSLGLDLQELGINAELNNVDATAEADRSKRLRTDDSGFGYSDDQVGDTVQPRSLQMDEQPLSSMSGTLGSAVVKFENDVHGAANPEPEDWQVGLQGCLTAEVTNDWGL